MVILDYQNNRLFPTPAEIEYVLLVGVLDVPFEVLTFTSLLNIFLLILGISIFMVVICHENQA